MVSRNLSSLPPEVLRQIAQFLPLPDIYSLLVSGPKCFRELGCHTIHSTSFAPWRKRCFAYQRIYLRTVRETQDWAVGMKIQGQGNIVASGQVRVRTALEQKLEEETRARAGDLGFLPALAGAQVDVGTDPVSAGPVSQREQGPGSSYADVPPILLPRIALEMIFYALEHLSEAGLGYLKLPSLQCRLSAITGVLSQRYPRLELVQKFIPIPLLPQSLSPPGEITETAAAYKILTAYLFCTSLAPNDIPGVLSDALYAYNRDLYAVKTVRGEQEMALVEYFHFLRLFLMMYECDQTLRGRVPRHNSNDIMSRQGRRMLAGRLDVWIRDYFRLERPLPPPPAATPVMRYNVMQSPRSPAGSQFERTSSMGYGTHSGPGEGAMSPSSWSTARSYHPNSSTLTAAVQQNILGPTLTKEQEQIVGTDVISGDLMKVRAYAGTGKTMSLTEYAKARPQQRFLYVAFNKSARDDAENKFPRNVDCKTIHSIALRVLHIYAPQIKDSLPDYRKTINDRRWDGRMPTMEIPPYSFSAKHVVEMLNLENGTNMIRSALANPELHSLPGARRRQEGKMLFPAANAVASCVKRTLERYWSSKDLELGRESLPFAMIGKLGLRSDVLLRWAKKLWKGMVAAEVKYFPHDAYLKLLYLDGVQQKEGSTGVGGVGLNSVRGSGVNIVRGGGDTAAFGQYEVIMFDEAQDSNPSMAEIILRQRPWAGLIVVGDPYQKIYGFRGATNECFDDVAHLPTHSFYLTHSFRFGDRIAGVANVLLGALRENVGVNGVRKEDSVKRGLPQQLEMSLKRSSNEIQILESGEIESGGSGKYTVIFRKNITLVEYAIEYCISHRHLRHRIALHTARNFTKSTLFALLRAAFLLFHEGMAARTGILAGYKTWQELKDHVEAENSEDGSGTTDSPGLGLVVGLEEHIGKRDFLRTIATCESMVTDKINEAEADVILITTHQAKGQEWDRVVVADDFNPSYDHRGSLGRTKHWREEMFMTYVAVTRARKELIVGEKVAAWLAGEMGAYRFYISPVQGKGKCPVCCHRSAGVEPFEDEVVGDLQSRTEAVLMGYECLFPTGSFGAKITEPVARSRMPFGGKKDVLVCDLCVQRWLSEDQDGTNDELVETSFPLSRILDRLAAVSQSTQTGVYIGALTERSPFSVVYKPASLAESDRVTRWVNVGSSLSVMATLGEEAGVMVLVPRHGGNGEDGSYEAWEADDGGSDPYET